MEHLALASSNATLLHARGGPGRICKQIFDSFDAKSVHLRPVGSNRHVSSWAASALALLARSARGWAKDWEEERVTRVSELLDLTLKERIIGAFKG